MGSEEVEMAAPDGDAATASTSAVTSPPMIAADVSGGKQPTYLELITSKTSATTPGATPPGKADAPAEASKETPGKTKRERADDNWKLLDGIITESEQFEKGSSERSKVLEKLHHVLRTISKRPRTDGILTPTSKKYEFASAAEEWDDFLAPSCETCSQFIEGGCKCEELEEHAASFLAPGEDMEEAGEELMSGGGSVIAASAK